MKKHFEYKIAVSGSAVYLEPSAKEKARIIGQELAKRNIVVLTGATSGYPHLAAMGAKDEDGVTIGFSPALSEKEHRKKYRLPVDHHDLIVYTGFGYAGRNLMLVRSADAVIHINGRIGTLNEFTNAFEDRKIIGVLTGTGGTSAFIDDILEAAQRGSGHVIFHDDPVELVDRVMILLRKVS